MAMVFLANYTHTLSNHQTGTNYTMEFQLGEPYWPMGYG